MTALNGYAGRKRKENKQSSRWNKQAVSPVNQAASRQYTSVQLVPASFSSVQGLLLVQDNGLPHDGVLPGHSPPEGTFDLGSESQLVQVVGFLSAGHESLFV